MSFAISVAFAARSRTTTECRSLKHGIVVWDPNDKAHLHEETLLPPCMMMKAPLRCVVHSFFWGRFFDGIWARPERVQVKMMCYPIFLESNFKFWGSQGTRQSPMHIGTPPHPKDVQIIDRGSNPPPPGCLSAWIEIFKTTPKRKKKLLKVHLLLWCDVQAQC